MNISEVPAVSPEPVLSPQQSGCLGRTLQNPCLPHHCRPDSQFHIRGDQVPGRARGGEGRAPPSLSPRISLNPRSKHRPPQASLQMEQVTCCPLTHSGSPSPARDPLQPPGTPPAREPPGGMDPPPHTRQPQPLPHSLPPLQRRPPVWAPQGSKGEPLTLPLTTDRPSPL